MRREILANDQFYHVYNRGVDKRRIFLDDKDRFRFIHDLFIFNDSNMVPNVFYHLNRTLRVATERRPRNTLVEIIAFCLMPNHYHLLLKQRQKGGISLFLQKLGAGYSRYFNERHQRNGVLFQGTFRAIHITSDKYLSHLTRYIHLNPLDLKFPDWKNRGIENRTVVSLFLNQYRWSSYLDYIGKKNFPSVTSREFAMGYFNESQKEYEEFVLEWTKKDFSTVESIILEKD